MKELLDFLNSFNAQKKEELAEFKHKSVELQKKYGSLTEWPKIFENRTFFEKEITSLTKLTTQLDELIACLDEENIVVKIVSETYKKIEKKKVKSSMN